MAKTEKGHGNRVLLT